MTQTIVVIAASALARLLYLGAKVGHGGMDENAYKLQAELVAFHGFLKAPRMIAGGFLAHLPYLACASGLRILYLYALALASMLTDEFKWLSMAAVSSMAGVACVVFAACIGGHLGGELGATTAAALVGASPLCLGLGRRVLVDVPAAATQLGVLALATLGPEWWPAVSAALVVMLLTRESSRTMLLPLAVALWWLWRDWTWLVAIGVALPAYAVAIRALLGVWPWRFPTAFVVRVIKREKIPVEHYAMQRCKGGLHRLVVDLALVSPAVLVAAITSPNPTIVLAVLVMAAYAAPWLEQQIRSCLVVDLLLRIGVAVTLPWWATCLLLVVDAYVFARAWLRRGVYDPTTYDLAKAMGMFR